MDDNTLAAQYDQTQDLMDLCWNEAWLRESAQLEAEVDDRVEAGLVMTGYHRAVNALTSEQFNHLREQMKLQSLLFTRLRQWMKTWDLGAAFDDTDAIARRLIRAHLANPTPAQQLLIDNLLAQVTQTDRADEPSLLAVIATLSEMLTQEDWQAIAQVASASITSQILKAGQSPSETFAV